MSFKPLGRTDVIFVVGGGLLQVCRPASSPGSETGNGHTMKRLLHQAALEEELPQGSKRGRSQKGATLPARSNYPQEATT